ncbi:MAG: hypothetical protein GY903_29905 [Fuerstiella sp.]|nr:hypothetical protein [Fuerstiella sp.]MCP4858712.1 hypothetical protein [Fuerstiella sp.]
MTAHHERKWHLIFLMSIMTCLVFSAGPAAAQDVSGQTGDRVTFVKMPADQVRTELLQWLATSGAEQPVLEKVIALWADDAALAGLSGEQVLDLVVNSFAEADSAAQRLLRESNGAGPVEGIVFDGIRATPLFQNQLQLFRARWLTQHRYYDEALPLLSELLPENVVDPAGLLFYRAVCQSQLLQRQQALDSLSLLLNNTLDVPARLRIVGEVMQQELVGQVEEGMNQISLLMKDVERRLDLGRSGEHTQKQEDAIIAGLDKLLEEMDEKNKQQGGGGGGGGDSSQNPAGSQGADRSQIKGSTGKGDADHKELEEGGKWGLLNAKAEAKARELIRQKFPSNFLDQIGRYTKKLAEQKK